MASRRRRRRGRTQKWEEECGDGDGPSSHRSAAPAAISLSHFRLPPSLPPVPPPPRRPNHPRGGGRSKSHYTITKRREGTERERGEREGGSQSASMCPYEQSGRGNRRTDGERGEAREAPFSARSIAADRTTEAIRPPQRRKRQRERQKIHMY